MKRAATALLLAAALCLGAAEKLRITDATGGEGCAILQLAAELWKHHQWEIAIHSLDASAAFDKLDAGETDLVLVNGSDLPAARRNNAKRYATGSYIAVVNTKNPLRHISAGDLRLLFDVPRPKWELVSGSAADIHRHAVRSRRERFAGGKLLGAVSAGDGIFLLDTMEEALSLAANDPEALLWGPRTPGVPPEVVALEVDGVAPTRDNIRSGRYPFGIPRFAVFPAAPTAPALEFLRMLDTGAFARLLEDEGELAELPAVPK